MSESAMDNGMSGPASSQPPRPNNDPATQLRSDLLERSPAISLAAFATAQAADEPQRFDLLTVALASRNPLVGANAAEALEAYSEAAIGPLLQAIDAAHILVQLRIIRALDTIGSPQAVPPLVALLKTTECIPMRYTIIEALGNLGNPSLADLLRGYLDDADHHVREKTQAALEKLTA